MSKTIYVATIWYRDNDPLFSVTGLDASDVKRKALALMREQEELDAEDDDGVFPLAELCWSGVNAWASKEAQPGGCLGMPEENRIEMESSGITVY